MKRTPAVALALALGALLARCGGDDAPATSSQTSPLGFFVSSTTSTTGNLGGLAGADARCQSLASAVGAGGKTWHAYLSTETAPSRVDARDRIGRGPWMNARGAVVASTVDELHARKGDAQVFVDETGKMINGQWTGSPTPNQHDILTGSTAEGRLVPGSTCADWTSESTTLVAQVGHSDGLGPNQDTSGALSSWNSAHANQNCSNTAPRGGAGRIYCFAIN
jgi:hypothetical protein